MGLQRTWKKAGGRWAPLVFALSQGACASTSAMPAAKDVGSMVEQRSGLRPTWEPTSMESPQVTKAIDDLLGRDLTVEGAVQVALLGSPRLRSTYEELAIAQADLVQAGLLKNPVFSLGRTAWESEHIDPNLFASVEQDFLDLLTMPLRKRVAATQLEATKLSVGDSVLRLAADVRSAYFTAQAAEQVRVLRALLSEAADVSAELAERQHAAGTRSDLSLHSERAVASQARLDKKRSEGAAAEARERLNRLMGVWGPRTAWKLPPRLPDLPREDPTFEHLETLALQKRLDVDAARREVQALDRTLTLAKTTRWTGVVQVNVEAGRLRDSKRIAFGPSVALEVPLFDQRQASIARLEAFKRQAEDHLQALSIEARSEVREAWARTSTARAVAEELAQVLVPLRESIVGLSQQHYDAMLLGVYQLLQAKQNEFQTYQESIEALRDYWIARSDLERALGTRIPTSPVPPPSR